MAIEMPHTAIANGRTISSQPADFPDRAVVRMSLVAVREIPADDGSLAKASATIQAISSKKGDGLKS